MKARFQTTIDSPKLPKLALKVVGIPRVLSAQYERAIGPRALSAQYERAIGPRRVSAQYERAIGPRRVYLRSSKAPCLPEPLGPRGESI